MARDRDYIERLAQERFQGRFRNTFLEAIDRLKQDMDFEQIVSLIEAGDIEGAVRAVGLEPENFPDMKEVNAEALAAAGEETANRIPKSGKVKFEFEPGNPRAKRAVDELNTGLMRGLNGGPDISEEGKTAVRNHIREGLENGDNPRVVARRLRGTFNKVTQQFDGGIIGLTDKQQEFVGNARRQLQSGDPTEMRKYLGRKLRDRRFDSRVTRAIKNGETLDQATVDKLTNAYNRKYVKFRAETVARDQALSALTQGQQEGLDQAVQSGRVREDQIVQTWRFADDDRVRQSHRITNGQKRKRDEAFDTPLGPMRFPRDPQGTPANRIQCRCTLTIQFKQDEKVPGV